MPHFDRLELRSVASRELAAFRDLRAILGIAKSRAPSLRAQLKSIPIDQLKTRADLAHIPVVRTAQMAMLQAEKPPFGGLLATRITSLSRMIAGKDGRLHPEGRAKDWWGAGRALYAAEFRPTDVVLTAPPCAEDMAYPILESGLQALGAVTVPLNLQNPEHLISRTSANGFIGSFAQAQSLLNQLQTAPLFEKAIIIGPKLSHEMRNTLARFCRTIHQLYLRPELGVIAYQATEPDRLICNEGLIMEIVAPGTDRPLPIGQRGEIVITRLNGDYPLLRFGTGDFSNLISGTSPCGRTHYRLDAQITSSL